MYTIYFIVLQFDTYIFSNIFNQKIIDYFKYCVAILLIFADTTRTRIRMKLQTHIHI